MKLVLAQALVEGNSKLSWHLPIAVCACAIKRQMGLLMADEFSLQDFLFSLFDHFNTETQIRLRHYDSIFIYR